MTTHVYRYLHLICSGIDGDGAITLNVTIATIAVTGGRWYCDVAGCCSLWPGDAVRWHDIANCCWPVILNAYLTPDTWTLLLQRCCYPGIVLLLTLLVDRPVFERSDCWTRFPVGYCWLPVIGWCCSGVVICSFPGVRCCWCPVAFWPCLRCSVLDRYPPPLPLPRCWTRCCYPLPCCSRSVGVPLPAVMPCCLMPPERYCCSRCPLPCPPVGPTRCCYVVYDCLLFRYSTGIDC